MKRAPKAESSVGRAAAKPASPQPRPRGKPKPTPQRKARTGAASVGEPVAPALPESAVAEYVLKLYVTGVTKASTLATERVRAVCEMHLSGRHRLEVIDIHQLPTLARQDQIVATPTLIRVLPPPLRRLIGSLASEEKILCGLDLYKR